MPIDLAQLLAMFRQSSEPDPRLEALAQLKEKDILAPAPFQAPGMKGEAEEREYRRKNVPEEFDPNAGREAEKNEFYLPPQQFLLLPRSRRQFFFDDMGGEGDVPNDWSPDKGIPLTPEDEEQEEAEKGYKKGRLQRTIRRPRRNRI